MAEVKAIQRSEPAVSQQPRHEQWKKRKKTKAVMRKMKTIKTVKSGEMMQVVNICIYYMNL